MLEPTDALADSSAQPVFLRRETLHRTGGSTLELIEYAVGEFEWRNDADRSTCIIAGVAEVDLADGRSLRLRKGGALYLPRGLHGRWVVRERLRTISVHTSMGATS